MYTEPGGAIAHVATRSCAYAPFPRDVQFPANSCTEEVAEVQTSGTPGWMLPGKREKDIGPPTLQLSMATEVKEPTLVQKPCHREINSGS